MITALIVIGSLLGVYALLVLVGLIWRPERQTILLGIVVGPVRMTSATDEFYDTSSRATLFFFQRPVFKDGATFWVNHIQYKSHFFWLLTWPMGHHFCIQPRLQKIEPNPNAANDPANPTQRVPGSELCTPYWRWPGWCDRSYGMELGGGSVYGHLD